MAQLSQAGPEDHLILLGHLKWAVPRDWYSHEEKPSLHSPRTPQPHPWRPPQSPSGNGEDVGTREGSSLLVRHQCWHHWLHLQVHHLHKASPAAQPMLPRDILCDLWHKITADYFNQKGKEYLFICNLFSKYPFLSKVSSKFAFSLSQKLQELLSLYGPPSLIYTQWLSICIWWVHQVLAVTLYQPHFSWSNASSSIK